MEKSANEIGYDFSGVDAPENSKDLYSLRYGTFVVPIIKAVQEQQKLIDEQQQSIETLVEENKELKADITAIMIQMGLVVK